MYPIVSCHAGVSQQVTIGREFVVEGEVEWSQVGDVENQVQLEPEQCQY